MPEPGNANISVRREARTDLQRFRAQATGLTERFVSLSEALRIAIAVASEHPDEVRNHGHDPQQPRN